MAIFVAILFLLVVVSLSMAIVFIKGLYREIEMLRSSLDSLGRWANAANKELQELQEQVQLNSSDIEALEDVNDDPYFRDRVIKILEEHFEEQGTKYIVLRAEQDYKGKVY